MSCPMAIMDPMSSEHHMYALQPQSPSPAQMPYHSDSFDLWRFFQLHDLNRDGFFLDGAKPTAGPRRSKKAGHAPQFLLRALSSLPLPSYPLPPVRLSSLPYLPTSLSRPPPPPPSCPTSLSIFPRPSPSPSPFTSHPFLIPLLYLPLLALSSTSLSSHSPCTLSLVGCRW
ncbi:hypothetical protein B0H14DRAFT_3490678 [Mycena olivaceomarginata]|nr:hypothetical protein B0H14DRAFT_3490678 [Mycena olivaceomarginata]